MEILEDTSIEAISAQLAEQGRYHLAATMNLNYRLSARKYMAKLYDYSPIRSLDLTLEKTLHTHLRELGYSQNDLRSVSEFLTRKGCIQTAPHLGVTQSKRMLCITWLTSLTISKNDPIVIGYYSGVPFSNSSRPGRFNDGVEENQLIPSRYQNQLACRHEITTKLVSTIQDKAPLVYKMHKPKLGEDFTSWTLLLTRKLDQSIFPGRNLIYFDINAVTAGYLKAIVSDTDHIIWQILFSPEKRECFCKSFLDTNIWFYAAYNSVKGESQESVYLNMDGLWGKHIGLVDSPEKLVDLLEEKKLVPATLLVFLVWSFLNHIKTFGSFFQIEYLSNFKDLWTMSGLLDDYQIDKVPTVNLTTGMFSEPALNRNNIQAYYDGNWMPDPDAVSMGSLWLAMSKVLLPG